MIKKFLFLSFFLLPMTLASCSLGAKPSTTPKPSVAELEQYDVATFAGGCFWCVEAAFEKIAGVKAAISGYSGGEEENPTYHEVSSGNTSHLEAVQVYYDAEVVEYKQLVEFFWKQIDPTDKGGQFVDRGNQYRSAIFYHSEEQKEIAEQSKADLAASDRFDDPIVTEIIPFIAFYNAEDYHQDYYQKNPVRYDIYRSGSGRDSFLEDTWGIEAHTTPKSAAGDEEYSRPSDAEIEDMLTPLQYKVTQEEGTEAPFQNEYWDNKADGIYVDVVSGEPLFSSRDKYDSGTGWPSFSRPLESENIVEEKDYKLAMPRTEVRSKNGDSHLGHVFNDGPESTGLRYCMNSAALRFIPKEDLEEEGYGEYVELFDE